MCCEHTGSKSTRVERVDFNFDPCLFTASWVVFSGSINLVEFNPVDRPNSFIVTAKKINPPMLHHRVSNSSDEIYPAVNKLRITNMLRPPTVNFGFFKSSELFI